MTRLPAALALSGLVVLAACASPDSGRPDSAAAPAGTPVSPSSSPQGQERPDFDARAWREAAERAGVWATGGGSGDDEALRAVMHAYADTLDAALDWRGACDQYWDAEAQAFVSDPMPRDDEHEMRGEMALYPIAADEYLVEVTCVFAAYQGSYVLAHLEGSEATLLRSQSYDDQGRPYGPPDPIFATVGFDEVEPRVFTTFSKGRGFGDCGVLTRFRIGRGAETTLLEVRARTCEDVIAETDEYIDPATWPVVYTAP